MKLSIVIVNWNTADLIRKSVESIERYMSEIEKEIIIIDNASHDTSVSLIETSFPQVKLLKNKQNVGPVKAHNQGIRMSTGDYVLLLDSDTYFIDSSLSTLLAFMQSNSQIGLITPQLVNENLSLQRSCFPFPSFTSELIERYEFILQWFRFFSKEPMKVTIKEPIEVDWISAACLLIRRKVFETIGYFDENFFIYYDDLDFCLRVKKTDWKIYYYPDARVVHIGGKSFNTNTEKIGIIKNINNLLIIMRSWDYYIKKNWNFFIRQTYCALDILASIMRIIISALRLFLLKDIEYRILLIRYEFVRLRFNLLGI